MPATPNQLTDQVTRHQVFTEGLKTQQYNDLYKVLKDGQNRIIADLATSEIRDWTTIQLNKRLDHFTKLLYDIYDEKITPQLFEDIYNFAIYESEFEKRSLENVVQHDFDIPSDSQIRAAVTSQPLSIAGPDKGQLLEPFVADWNDRDKSRIVNAIRSGFATGQTTNDLIYSLKNEAFKINDRDLKALVRTSLQHAATVAREETFKANADIIKRVRIVATLDKRTTDICRGLDQRVFKIDEGPRPPFHIQCRTTFEAVLDERFKFLDAGGTRSARDPATGKVTKVNADESYYGWLKKQPKAVQQEIIGIKRSKLLRDGGLTSQRFSELQLNKNFKPLTLDEMKKLEPLAFLKADVKL